MEQNWILDFPAVSAYNKSSHDTLVGSLPVHLPHTSLSFACLHAMVHRALFSWETVASHSACQIPPPYLDPVPRPIHLLYQELFSHSLLTHFLNQDNLLFLLCPQELTLIPLSGSMHSCPPWVVLICVGIVPVPLTENYLRHGCVLFSLLPWKLKTN